GTEFLAVVEADGRTTLTVFDGEVQFSNTLGSVILTNGEQGTVQAGQAPVKTPVLQTTNIVQWWLYYPGIFDPDELGLNGAERNALANSLAAYRTGDLKQALYAYPAGRTPQSDAEQVLFAALLLSVGKVDRAEQILNSISPQSSEVRFAVALRQIISIVTGKE